MPDLSAVAAPVFEILRPLLGPLVKRALGAFFQTAAGMVALGIAVAIGAWMIAAESVWWHGLLAAIAAAALFAVLGGMLAMKRAVATTLIRALDELSLGNKLLRAIFDRVLAVDDARALGDRGIDAVRTVERMPLAQAEARLRAVADRLIRGEDGERRGIAGWMGRKLNAALVERIEAITLTRFREADAREGGVDVVKVRDELAAKVDALVADQLRSALARITVLMVGGATAGSIAIAVLIRRALAG